MLNDIRTRYENENEQHQQPSKTSRDASELNLTEKKISLHHQEDN
jgi:hypothetical protein